MTYIIMGPQGSGKGTQAKLIAKEYNLKHVSLGDLIRAEISKNTETGQIIKKYVEEGKLIPAEINKKMVKEVLENNKNVLLDGFPRNLEQAEFLEQNTEIRGAIVITISEQETINRLSKRLICTANNKILIEDQITEQDKQECEALGGTIIKRDDDKPEAIKKRLDIYNNETRPAITFLKNKNVPVIEINGEKKIQELFNEIKEKTQILFEN